MFLADGRLRLGPNQTLKLLTSLSSPKTPDISERRIIDIISRSQAANTIVIPPRLRRPTEGPQHSAKVIPQKRRAESDIPSTTSLRIRIPSLKERAPFMRANDDKDGSDDEIDSDGTYSECSDESEDESTDINIEELHDQSDWERSSPDPHAAAHLLTLPRTSSTSTPL
ncbi:hypothetical protein DFH29DRAFT_925824 [Suillus ampliporus]|nr:hypothetical protein DFH29DRAFT_925824 [Suillus ampliporus]